MFGGLAEVLAPRFKRQRFQALDLQRTNLRVALRPHQHQQLFRQHFTLREVRRMGVGEVAGERCAGRRHQKGSPKPPRASPHGWEALGFQLTGKI